MGRRVGAFHGRLCSIQSGNIQCYGEDGRFGSGVTPLIGIAEAISGREG